MIEHSFMWLLLQLQTVIAATGIVPVCWVSRPEDADCIPQVWSYLSFFVTENGHSMTFLHTSVLQ